MAELTRRYLEEEQDAELPCRRDELLRCTELVDPTLSEQQADEQEERDGRQAEATGEVRQEREQQQDDTELEQECFHGQPAYPRRMCRTPSMPLVVPTTTSESPPWSTSSGTGDAMTWSPRTTAWSTWTARAT